MIKRIVKIILPTPIIEFLLSVKDNYFGGFSNNSFSQEGEDRILQRFFENKKNGFYVDVGAYHPLRFSNTHLFYKRGWSGINIDAMPGSMKVFDKRRPRDINLEQSVANEETELIYHIFNEPALNSFSKELSEERENGNNPYNVIEKILLKTRKLSQILEEHVPKWQTIDFLSIDVEGLDFDILKSNNWEKYSPKVILIEILSKSVEEVLGSDIHTYLSERGYTLFSKCFQTVMYKRKDEGEISRNRCTTTVST